MLKRFAGTALIVALAAPAIGTAQSTFGGGYAGVSTGYSHSEADWTSTANYNPPGDQINPLSNPEASLADHEPAYKLFAGYDFTDAGGDMLYGVDLTLMHAKLEDDIGRIPGLFSNPGTRSTSTVETDLAVSIGLRAGKMVNEDTLVYARLSADQLDVESTSTCDSDGQNCNPGAAPQYQETEETARGWGLAVGMEQTLEDNLRLRLAYTYIDYGDVDFQALTPSFDTFGADAEVSVKTETVEVGLIWAF